jgi:hypothetical protein
MSDPAICDPWSQILALLSAISGDSATIARSVGFVPRYVEANRTWERVDVHECSVGKITLIERLSSRQLTVNWSDATSCRYCEQYWIIGVAQHDGICALSGSSIERGDTIFHPQRIPRTKTKPTNKQAMMLESAVNAAMPVSTQF